MTKGRLKDECSNGDDIRLVGRDTKQTLNVSDERLNDRCVSFQSSG